MNLMFIRRFQNPLSWEMRGKMDDIYFRSYNYLYFYQTKKSIVKGKKEPIFISIVIYYRDELRDHIYHESLFTKHCYADGKIYEMRSMGI